MSSLQIAWLRSRRGAKSQLLNIVRLSVTLGICDFCAIANHLRYGYLWAPDLIFNFINFLKIYYYWFSRKAHSSACHGITPWPRVKDFTVRPDLTQYPSICYKYMALSPSSFVCICFGMPLLTLLFWSKSFDCEWIWFFIRTFHLSFNLIKISKILFCYFVGWRKSTDEFSP